MMARRPLLVLLWMGFATIVSGAATVWGFGPSAVFPTPVGTKGVAALPSRYTSATAAPSRDEATCTESPLASSGLMEIDSMRARSALGPNRAAPGGLISGVP